VWYTPFEMTLLRWRFPVFLLTLALVVPAAPWSEGPHVHLAESEGGHWWVAPLHCPWHRMETDEAPALTTGSGQAHLESGHSRYCSSCDLEPASDLPGSPRTPRTRTEAPEGPTVPDTAGPRPGSTGLAWPVTPPGEGSLLPLRI